jgi:hypothetical protein
VEGVRVPGGRFGWWLVIVWRWPCWLCCFWLLIIMLQRFPLILLLLALLISPDTCTTYG